METSRTATKGDIPMTFDNLEKIASKRDEDYSNEYWQKFNKDVFTVFIILAWTFIIFVLGYMAR